jgi:urease accessory protein
MMTLDSVLGNIYKDPSLKKKYDEMMSSSLCESIKISRMESQRVRMRKTSNKGTDIALIMPPGSKLRHGDVLLLSAEQMIVLEMQPENVISLEIKENLHEDDIVEIPAKIGHAIGNLHRPLKLEGRNIYFPIQAESEVEMFKKIFSSLEGHLEIKSMKMVFEPDEGMDIHEH